MPRQMLLMSLTMVWCQSAQLQTLPADDTGSLGLWESDNWRYPGKGRVLQVREDRYRAWVTKIIYSMWACSQTKVRNTSWDYQFPPLQLPRTGQGMLGTHIATPASASLSSCHCTLISNWRTCLFTPSFYVGLSMFQSKWLLYSSPLPFALS